MNAEDNFVKFVLDCSDTCDCCRVFSKDALRKVAQKTEHLWKNQNHCHSIMCNVGINIVSTEMQVLLLDSFVKKQYRASVITSRQNAGRMILIVFFMSD